jgi:hypothetical protein
VIMRLTGLSNAKIMLVMQSLCRHGNTPESH